ncbi:MAG: LysM peptidoglycan-binding domain-containing protein [Tumebacillaceae bacterium]
MKNRLFWSAVMVVWCGVMFSMIAQERAIGSSGYEEVIVNRGESLWSIAAERNVEGRDVRELIAAVRKANDLDRGPLRIGQRLLVPREW